MDTFGDRLRSTLTSFWAELWSRPGRGSRGLAVVVAVATQAVERARLAAVLLPVTFDHVLSRSIAGGHGATFTAVVAGLVIGVLFFAWCIVIGGSFQVAQRRFPVTSRAFLVNHPGAVRAVARAIDGFSNLEMPDGTDCTAPERQVEVGPYSAAETGAESVLLALSRSIRTAFIFGTTAHVGMAAISNHSRRSVTRRLIATSSEAAALFTLIAVVLSAMISNDFLGIAERTRQILSNERIFIGASIVLIAYSAVANSIARRSALRAEIT